MDWEAIGAIGEIVGAAAVILTLIFLSLQIRQNTKAVRTEATTSAATIVQAFYLGLGTNEQAACVWFNGMIDPESITPEERMQFIVLCQSGFMAFQTSFLLDEQGALDTQIRDSITSGILVAKDTLGFKFFWAQRRSSYNESFRKYVDELASRVEESEGSAMYIKPT